MLKSFWCHCEWPYEVGFLLRLVLDVPGFGAGRPGVLAAGMLKSRAGMTAVTRRGPGARHLGLLAPRSASGLGPGPREAGRACPDSVQPSW